MNPLLKKKLMAYFESTDYQLGKARHVVSQATSYSMRAFQPDVFKIILKEIINNKAAYLTWTQSVCEPHEKIVELQTNLNEAYARYNYALTDPERQIQSDKIQKLEHDLEILKPLRANGLQVLKAMLEQPVEQRIGEKITRLKNSTIPTQIESLNDMIAKGESIFTSLGFTHDEFVKLCSASATYSETLKRQNAITAQTDPKSKKKQSQLDDEVFEFIQSNIKRMGQKKGLISYTEDDLVRITSIVEVANLFEAEKAKLEPLVEKLGSTAQKRVYKNNTGITSDTPRFDYYFAEFARRFYSDEALPENEHENFKYIANILSELKPSQKEPHKHNGSAPSTSNKGGMGTK